MKNFDLKIRRATQNDCLFIAEAVVMGIGDCQTVVEYCGENYIEVLEAIAGCEGTQYSYHNVFVAEVGGKVVGALVGYDGANLYPLREGTFSVIARYKSEMPNVADETQPGEFYIDTLAVDPEFRNRGIGTTLLKYIVQWAGEQGFPEVGLIVDSENPQAMELYKRVGFEVCGTKNFFGHNMWHMQIG